MFCLNSKKNQLKGICEDLVIGNCFINYSVSVHKICTLSVTYLELYGHLSINIHESSINIILMHIAPYT